MPSRLWKFLTTDIRDLVLLDTVDESVDTAEAVLGLAEALAEEGPKIQKLAPLVTQLDSLLDVLNSPLGKIAEASLPFVSIGTGLLKFYLETTKQEPTVAQSVAVVSQAAYLETVKTFLEQPKLKNWLAKMGKKPASDLVKEKLKKLESVELGDTEARRALLYFHESKLALAYNEVLIARLVELGAKTEQATKFAEKRARETNRIMLQTLISQSDSVKALVEWYRIGGNAVFEKYFSIDTYLEEWIAPRPHEKVFAESFSFKDIYVPLKAQPLTTAGVVNENKEPVVLEQWARKLLNDDTQRDRVMFLQGGPGRGKSVFCRMFADWVRRHEHPRWTPILIRLRDVSVLSKDFEETLAKAVDRDFAKTDSGWLTDRHVNFLFLLDGFDELLMEGRTTSGLDHFLDQVGRFQEQCARNSEKGHRVLITGRTLALQAIESRMPINLARMDIQPMDDELQQQWFYRWGNLIGHDKAHLTEILQNPHWPDQARELAREPLLLYLLSAMYRDGELRLDMFEGADGNAAKILIYERTLDWVLTKQRAEGYRRNTHSQTTVVARNLNPDITELAPENVRRILQEAGLCVVQSGMEFASIKAIEDRLTQDTAAKAFLAAAQKRLKTGDTPLRNALAAFYLQEGQQGEGSIEFIHKSFGEFLCAERIVNSLIDVCQPGRNREYDIDAPAFCWTMYDLLGCRVLTLEIVEYLTALLLKHPEFTAKRLHQRLYDFYWRWSDGEFMDAPPENLPQQKMRLLRKRMPDRKETLGQSQIDLYAGMNTMVLLWELHHYGLKLVPPQENAKAEAEESSKQLQTPFAFHPCQHPESKEFDELRLLKIISTSHCIGTNAFIEHIGPLLFSVNLSRANLSRTDLCSTNLLGTNLSRANLSRADLSRTDLRSANLSRANLSRADLSRANLSRTNLSHADLSHADLNSATLFSTNLRSANLRSADLSYADFSYADLRSADLSHAYFFSTYLCSADLRSADLRSADLRSTNLTRAILSDEYDEVQWDEETNWDEVRGLPKNRIPAKLRNRPTQE